ncbi:MAG: GNAT family N-acetyltransferase [Ornithinimicrobium sp.]
MAIRLDFLTDAGEFLGIAGEHLQEEPVKNTVVATSAQRFAAGLQGDADDWWLVVREGHAVVGAGMRTASFASRPVSLLSMPAEAARLLACTLHHHQEALVQVNGALPTVRVCAEESARLIGGSVQVSMRTRLLEVRKVIAPPRAEGHLRVARARDVALAIAWCAAFMADADEQAARPPGSTHHHVQDRDAMLRQIDDGQWWLWVDRTNEPLHLTRVRPVSFGAARLGPVYTPPVHRGRGYASTAVADISQRILDQGARPCLLTDQANPTSSKLYRALGYRSVSDMADLVIKEECPTD